MEKMTPGALTAVLSAYRQRLNSLFELERLRRPSLDGAGFLALFSRAAEHLPPQAQSVEAVVLEFYETVLKLYSRDIIGESSRFPGFDETFYALTARYPAVAASSGGKFYAGLANSIINVAALGAGVLKAWTEKMSLLPDTSDSGLFHKTGLVAAWVSGLACYREAAIRACREIPPEIFSGLFGLSGVLDSAMRDRIAERLELNPWLDVPIVAGMGEYPAGIIVRHAGAFAGFGGSFARPPEVFIHEGAFHAADGERCFRVYCDYYGAMLVKTEMPEERDRVRFNQSDFTLGEPRTALANNRTWGLPGYLPDKIASRVSDSRTLLFTSPLSHKVFILGLEGD